MKEAGNWTTILLPNGVGRVPLGSEEDLPERQCFDAVLDLMICLRGTELNRHLGQADHVMAVGEQRLAPEEVVASLQDDRNMDAGSAAALRRARHLLGVK